MEKVSLKEEARSWMESGDYYLNTGESMKSEDAFLRAIQCFEKLQRKGKQSYDAELANCYSGISFTYMVMEQYEDADRYSRKAIKIYEELVKKDADTYEVDLALSYITYGVANGDEGSIQKARTIANKHPEKEEYQDILAFLDEE